jgi:hypothetical protein
VFHIQRTNTLQGRNTGLKAIFGGAQKKPLMTKVSMRHLNEIVRERNQYSRDAMEAWQDFINLKSRMDMELTKVSKRNNFLVEELESWKQQFLKFQAFAEQLTKETQDLKIKIDTHKRENRRLTNLIDQQKDDAARLATRLSGTEKQRDDALEALVLQQEIAEELERERKRNKKELSAMQHTSSTLLRQRDEAQRVVLHLRALIDGQAHHMEHIVKSLSTAPELSEYLEEGYNEDEEDETFSHVSSEADAKSEATDQVVQRVVQRATSQQFRRAASQQFRQPSRSVSRASTADGKMLDGEDVSPDMEDRLLNNPLARNRMSTLSMADVADRHLRDKTDAIAYIIRNISEQCAAAVEGLELARHAEDENASEADVGESNRSSGKSPVGTLRKVSSTHGRQSSTNSSQVASSHGSDFGDDQSSVYLGPSSRTISVPPTPDLVGGRSGTSMSMTSASTTPERYSLQHYPKEEPDVPTRVAEADEDVEEIHGRQMEDSNSKFSGDVRHSSSTNLTIINRN